MKRSLNEARPTGRHLGGMTIAKVTYESTSLTTDEDAPFQTIGEMLDKQLAERLDNHELIQEVTFHFDTQNPEAMETLRSLYRALR